MTETNSTDNVGAARTVRRPVFLLVSAAAISSFATAALLSVRDYPLAPRDGGGMKAAIDGWVGRKRTEADGGRCGGDGEWRDSSELSMNHTVGVFIAAAASSSADGSAGAATDVVVGLSEARVEVVNVPTAMRPDPIPATIILPGSYPFHHASDDDDDSRRAYPVLYVLHGAGDTHSGWLRHVPSLLAFSTRYNLIIVCPDGGRTSWYFDSHLDAAYQYETFVSSELVRYVDSNYLTLSGGGEGRAIMGNSMGGHGALFLSIKHPEVFGTAVSLSGGVDVRPFHDKFDLEKRLGPLGESRERWDNATVTHLAQTLLPQNTKLGISLDCGMGDFFLKVNRELHRVLEKRRIPHEYAERPGGHGWEYWKKAVRRQMVFVDERLNG